MQITDLLVPERVALNMQVADKAMAIHAMVGMLDRTGCLRDAVEYEKNVLEREAQGTTGVGGGVAIPHGKSNAVLVPALAALALPLVGSSSTFRRRRRMFTSTILTSPK